MAADIGRAVVAGGDYDLARQALVESIEAEGLVPGPVSQFGDLLKRSDAALGHGADIYERAEIFSFCSIAVSAQLVLEDPERIADCPLTIALYRRKGSDEVRMAYRRREGATPGALAANRLLERIVGRSLELLPRPRLR